MHIPIWTVVSGVDLFVGPLVNGVGGSREFGEECALIVSWRKVGL